MKIKREIEQLFVYVKWVAKDTKAFIGLLILILTLEVISTLSGVAIAIVSKHIIDNAVKGALNTAVMFAAIFGSLILMSIGLRAIASLTTVRINEALSNSIRQRLFTKISKTEWMSISKYHSGDILTRLTSDVNAVAGGVTGTVPSIITLGVQLIAAFSTLLYYEPYLAILAFVMGPFTVLFSRFWGRKLKFLHVKVQESESAYRSFIQESLQNMLIVKTFRLEEKSEQNISALHGSRMKWVIKRNRTSVAASTALGLGYWTGYFLAFCWGAVRLSRGGTTFGTLTAFLQLVEQVQVPFIGLSRTLPQLISTMASAGRLMELEKLPVEDSLKKIPLCSSAGIRYKSVSFSYSDAKPILESISANINPGEIVALVGSSGEGKTTFIRILLALLKPNNGEAYLLDEEGVKYNISSETRDWISYVPQGNTLFSGTIADNIWCGCNEASLEELQKAAIAASAWEFIKDLPDGINTVIGERGIGLSEGQAQRIAIARALLRKAPILLLDEATSALDMESEMRVLKGIKEMNPSRTCIVITHRPSALGICSRVLKLQDGRLVEMEVDSAENECAAAI